MDVLINSFFGNIEKCWGCCELKIVGKNNYVKYIDNYFSCFEVNFIEGWIIVEIVLFIDFKVYLCNVIIIILLIFDDFVYVDFFFLKDIEFKG